MEVRVRVRKVRVSGNNHLRALQIFLDITDAALQAVAQHQAQISALEKARKEEAEFMKKEERRLQKQKEDEQKKAEKKADKEAKKRKAEEAKALAAEAKKRAGPHPDEPQDEEKPKTGSGKARKGKGAGDLSESDHAILRAKLPGRAVPVLRDGKSFVETIALGVPCIWRCTRSCLKKSLEHHGSTTKDATTACIGVSADKTQFSAEFAEIMEAGGHGLGGGCGV